ncbi:MAG: type II secretion system protein [Acidobacteria bacterium]|nr:type II secretion system protein [Acidobacteriota bacterium]
MNRRIMGQRGMSLLELIIVMAIIGILAAVAVPLLKNAPRRAQEAALKQNLRVMRDAIEQHYADKGHYPPSLQALVEEEYLRTIPLDPITRNDDTWVEVLAEFPALSDEEPWAETDLSPFGDPGIEDVHSGSEENALDGGAYADW